MARLAPLNSLLGSYLGAALGRDENRIAAVVTVAIAAGVLIFTFVPQRGDVSIDFDRLEPRRRHEITLEGFLLAPKRGWILGDARGTVVVHRRLPAQVEIEVGARRTRPGAPPTRVLVEYGGVEHALVFDAEHLVARARFEAARPSRRISFELEPDGGLQLTRVRVSSGGAAR